jgi:hypothetical protein
MRPARHARRSPRASSRDLSSGLAPPCPAAARRGARAALRAGLGALGLTGLVACSQAASVSTSGGGAGGELGLGAGYVGGAIEGAACDGAPFYELPEDPSAVGPWPVGARTVEVAGLVTEVWYPAQRGSEEGANAKVYDPRLWLPEESQGLIPDADNPYQRCACADGLPLDDTHGPYPVVLFLHGTAGFRTQTLATMTHWASRGLVVVSADHPGLYLGDALSFNFDGDQAADAALLLEAIVSQSEGLSFLAGRVDASRLGVVGHSAGGSSLRALGGTSGVRVLIPMASGGVDEGEALESTLVLSALDDQVVAPEQQLEGYETSPAKKRFVGIDNAGHLAFSDLCGLQNGEGQDLVSIAQEHAVPGAELASILWDGCAEGQLAQAEATQITRWATSAVLEETLLCRPSSSLDQLALARPEVTDVREQLE